MAFALGACASASTEVQKADWEAGNVYPANYKPELLSYLRTYLNDPTGIRDAGIAEPALKPMGFGNRYVVCTRFSAKKGDGTYGGAKEYLVVYVGGKLDRFQEAKGDACKDAVYSAFPEMQRLAR